MRLQRRALTATAHGRSHERGKGSTHFVLQSIPPYYLRRHAQDCHVPDTARLVKFTNELDVNKYTEISGWKRKGAGSEPIDIK